MRNGFRIAVTIGILFWGTSLEAQILDFGFLSDLHSSAEPSSARFEIEYSSDCGWEHWGRQTTQNGELFLDVIAEYNPICLFVITRVSGEVEFGTLPTGHHRTHIRHVTRLRTTLEEFVAEEFIIDDLYVHPGQTEFYLLHEVLPPLEIEAGVPSLITGMSTAARFDRFFIADARSLKVAAFDEATRQLVGSVGDLAPYLPDALSGPSTLLVTDAATGQQAFLRLGGSAGRTVIDVDLPPGDPFTGLEWTVYTGYLAGRVNPPDLMALSTRTPVTGVRLGGGIPMSALDADGWRLVAVDPSGPRVVLIDAIELDDVLFDLVPPSDPLEPVGLLLDERSYPPEHIPSGASISWRRERILMPDQQDNLLEFRPLRIGFTGGGAVAPDWPPFLGAVDLIAGRIEDLSIGEGGVILGGSGCLADDLPHGGSAVTTEPPAGTALYYVARPSVPGADYGPGVRALRRVAPVGQDCAQTPG